jgi:metal-responsive CopG/Arc/MetJ family transcriptional regulator
MKTAVSIPDDVFNGAERLARHSRKSRSQLYSDALREYVSRHSVDETIDAWNSVIDKVSPGIDQFAAEAARRTLERSGW